VHLSCAHIYLHDATNHISKSGQHEDQEARCLSS
jgi:hypothetical protein